MKEEKMKENNFTRRVQKEIENSFKVILTMGHKCLFTGKKVTLDNIMKSDRQYKLCVLCRLFNILLTLTFVGEGMDKILKEIKANKGQEERPFYIG